VPVKVVIFQEGISGLKGGFKLEPEGKVHLSKNARKQIVDLSVPVCVQVFHEGMFGGSDQPESIVCLWGQRIVISRTGPGADSVGPVEVGGRGTFVAVGKLGIGAHL